MIFGKYDESNTASVICLNTIQMENIKANPWSIMDITYTHTDYNSSYPSNVISTPFVSSYLNTIDTGTDIVSTLSNLYFIHNKSLNLFKIKYRPYESQGIQQCPKWYLFWETDNICINQSLTKHIRNNISQIWALESLMYTLWQYRISQPKLYIAKIWGSPVWLTSYT